MPAGIGTSGPEAGGQLVAAAFAFLGEMIPQRQPTNGAEQKASEFKARLAAEIERWSKVIATANVERI